jgi:hypothetical protein
MPTIKPQANTAKTTMTSDVLHPAPKKKWTVISCWLLSANANSVKKMAALSTHLSNHVSLFILMSSNQKKSVAD